MSLILSGKKEEEPPSLKKLKKIEVTGFVRKNGFYIGVKRGPKQRKLEINYPLPIWSRYPQKLKQLLLDNLVYLATYHLPFIYEEPLRLEYSTFYPQISAPLMKNLTLSLPFYSFVKKGLTKERLLKIMLNSDYHFKSYVNRETSPNLKVFKSYSNHVIVPFTFGKDSLLTTALCHSLKIKPKLIYVEESEEVWENKQKRRLKRRFEKEFNLQVDFLKSPIDSLREKGEDGWFGWEFQLTCIVLLLIPFAYAHKARYIFFSNERSCDYFAYDREGFKFYPDLEQSKEWTRELSLITEGLTGGRVQVRDLLEPLEEMAIIRILHHLFPDFARYQSSCFSNHPRAKTQRWCGRCSKCARMYIFLKGNKVDPKTVGYNDNLLKGRFKKLYSAFGKQETRDSAYEISQVGRLEELFSFLLSHQNGSKGELMNLFRRQYLPKMKPYQEKLCHNFFSLYSFDLVPPKYRKKLRKIFLKGLRL